MFSNDGILPDPKKVTDFVNLQTPSTASEVCSPLSMTNYCSRIIHVYATKREPLQKLTHKDQPWRWMEEHDHAVSQLKEALANAPVTAYFDPEKDTEISADASPVGLAAILSQVDPKTEKRHSQTEREAVAVVWACEHLHLHIYGKSVTVHTDHKSPSIYLWQSRFQAACKNREMGSSTSALPDHRQVMKGRGQSCGLAIQVWG